MKAEKLELRRFQKTIDFLKKVEPDCKHILDLGVKNPLSEKLASLGYNVQNTMGEDLDLKPESITKYKNAEVITAFEILEHLVSPFVLLRNLPANRLVATVPLKLWFVKSYRNLNDKFDWHYHEFEPWQFDMLLEKAGWEIVYSEKWTASTYQLGIRPILRLFYPRFYAVHAIRKRD
ncbi:MAG TPA: methyltransferase [Bacteroidales bacterium]|nr:methyltransferase [Bacteroidales bacterium]